MKLTDMKPCLDYLATESSFDGKIEEGDLLYKDPSGCIVVYRNILSGDSKLFYYKKKIWELPETNSCEVVIADDEEKITRIRKRNGVVKTFKYTKADLLAFLRQQAEMLELHPKSELILQVYDMLKLVET